MLTVLLKLMLIQQGSSKTHRLGLGVLMQFCHRHMSQLDCDM